MLGVVLKFHVFIFIFITSFFFHVISAPSSFNELTYDGAQYAYLGLSGTLQIFYQFMKNVVVVH